MSVSVPTALRSDGCRNEEAGASESRRHFLSVTYSEPRRSETRFRCDSE